MRAEDWLTMETRESEAFVGFGGIEALVRQSTARAERNGGFNSVRVISARKEGNTYLIEAEVQFNQDPRAADNQAAATSERMIWRVRLVYEDSAWKLAM